MNWNVETQVENAYIRAVMCVQIRFFVLSFDYTHRFIRIENVCVCVYKSVYNNILLFYNYSNWFNR